LSSTGSGGNGRCGVSRPGFAGREF